MNTILRPIPLTFWMTAAALLFTVLTIIAGRNLHGSDEYWYLADTQTLLNGGSTAQHVFPVQVLQPEFNGAVPFIHNNLNMYLMLPLSRMLGPLAGWIATNLLCGIAMATLTALVVRGALGEKAGAWAFCAALLYPATFMLTTTPLLEASCALFPILSLTLFVHAREKFTDWLLLTLSLVLLVLSRMSYLPLLGLAPLACLWWRRPLSFGRLAQAGFLGAIVIATAAGADWLLPHGMKLSLTALLGNAVPDVADNMQFMFDLKTPELNPEYLWIKFLDAVRIQLALDAKAAVVWPFNLAALVVMISLIRKPDSDLQLRMNLFALAMIGLHAFTSVVHQPGLRYFVPAFPPVLCAALVSGSRLMNSLSGSLRHFLWARVPLAGAVSLLAFAGVDLLVTGRFAREGFAETAMRDQLEDQLPRLIPEHSTVLLEMTDKLIAAHREPPPEQLIEYTLWPRRVGYLRAQYSADQYRVILDRLQPGYLIATQSSPLRTDLGVPLTPVQADWPESLRHFQLYRIDGPQLAEGNVDGASAAAR